MLTAVKLLSLEEKGGEEKAKAMRYSYLLKVKNNMVWVSFMSLFHVFSNSSISQYPYLFNELYFIY